MILAISDKFDIANLMTWSLQTMFITPLIRDYLPFKTTLSGGLLERFYCNPSYPVWVWSCSPLLGSSIQQSKVVAGCRGRPHHTPYHQHTEYTDSP